MRAQNEAGTSLPETRADAGSLIEASAYLEMAAECFDIQRTKLDSLPQPDRDTWWNWLGKGIEFGSLDVEAFRGHLKIGRCFNETPRVSAGFGQ